MVDLGDAQGEHSQILQLSSAKEIDRANGIGPIDGQMVRMNVYDVDVRDAVVCEDAGESVGESCTELVRVGVEESVASSVKEGLIR